jgi:hypothetical protein
MQHGSRLPPIVGSLKGLNAYIDRHPSVTEMKRDAQRRHRRRVKQNLKEITAGADDEFDQAPNEGLDAWDVF